MKFVQIFFNFIIFIKILTCETATTYSARQANRKQQKLIEGSMDLEADPCEDFYQYACGKWQNLHLEAGDKYHEAVGLLDYNANKEFTRLFNRINLRNKPKFVKNAYEYYKSCKDVKKYEPLEYLKWMKEHENIKWPTLWTPSKIPVEFDWLRTLAIMRIYGLNNIFIEEIVMQRRDDPQKHIIDLDKPVSDGGFTPLIYEHLEVLIEALGVPMTKRAFLKLWQEIKDFEIQLKELDDIEDDIPEDDDSEDEDNEDDEKDLRLTTFKDLPFPWLKDYLRIILNQTDLDPAMELYIQNVPYMTALDKLLKQHNQRFICKYLEIRFLWHLHIDGPTNLVADDCAASTRSFMPLAMHWLYEQQHPELQAEFPKITELFEQIRIHLNKTIWANHHGFNKSEVFYLSHKINNMKLKINNLPRIDTVNSLENFYKNLSLNSEKFYANHLQLLKFYFLSHHALLSNSNKQDDYFYLENLETGFSSSPYFVQRSNVVVVPLTLLQQPIYYPELDDIYKYSALGFLLAHETIHGFDHTGLEIDYKGKMVPKRYAAIITNPLYNASFNCLLELNPTVIDEKIADVSGLRFAYQTLLDSNPDASTKSRRIYGRDISLSKLFFLNFAQFFCGTSNSDDSVTTTDHGSDRDRVIDALTHFPEFSKIYQCTSESSMHSHETCHIWRR